MNNAIEYNIKTDLNNKVYTSTFSIKNISASVEEQIKDEGEVILNVGGNITKEVTDELTSLTETVTLHAQGDKFIKFPSDLPYTREFSDVMLGGKAEEISKAYVAIMEKRITLAVNEITSRVDTFSDDRDIIL